MKRKVLIIFSLYFISLISLIWMQSCENVLSYEARICDLEFYGINSNYLNNQVDTLTEDIGFSIIADSKENCYVWPSSNIISTCFAATKCAKWQNEILPNSFELRFDKVLLILNDTIAPNTNLFQIPAFIEGIEIQKDEDDCKSVNYNIYLNNSLANQITFEQGIYRATFICKTNDNIAFNKKRQIVFKI